MIEKILTSYDCAVRLVLTWVAPLVLLLMRVVPAAAFFKSGQTKIANWDTTLYLFEDEYQVPFIPFELAAYMGTAAELILPPLLVLGIFTRLTSLSLFAFNIIAVISYPVIWGSGFYDHQLWGAMLLVGVIWGPGRLSIDHYLRAQFNR
ncbi:MAG: DoxX family protein [Oceanospirillaceae bacterium]|nr:DoxX family protein [Oceanospirillaceae bacterium]